MTHRKLILLELAKKDTDRIIKNAVIEYGFDHALKLIDALEKTYSRIRRFPKLGSSQIAHELDFEGLRSLSLKKFPFTIFYFDNEVDIKIIRLLHQKQEIPFWLQDSE